ncbi:hypothetical protein DFH09DRAFT_1075421 [Mycena vulgaris]|nr:hypothetical protein DFH09DRAFT_1075421 [Mycena vulgaris]
MWQLSVWFSDHSTGCFTRKNTEKEIEKGKSGKLRIPFEQGCGKYKATIYSLRHRARFKLNLSSQHERKIKQTAESKCGNKKVNGGREQRNCEYICEKMSSFDPAQGEAVEHDCSRPMDISGISQSGACTRCELLCRWRRVAVYDPAQITQLPRGCVDREFRAAYSIWMKVGGGEEVESKADGELSGSWTVPARVEK